MRRVLVLFGLMGCSGDTASGPDQLGPADLSTVPAAFDIISGDAQRDTIEALLAAPITLRLETADAAMEPIVGAIVNFVVVEQGCGQPFAGSALTDSDGRASERWGLGTRVGDCTMEARAVDSDGTPRVFGTVTATIDPGEPVSFDFAGPGQASAWVGDTIDTRGLVGVEDRAGNSVVGNVLVAPSDLEGSGDGRYWSVGERLASLDVFFQSRSHGSLQLAWMRDLGELRWSTSFRCLGLEPIDSVVVNVTSDSVSFTAPIGDAANTAGWMWFSGIRTEYSSEVQATETDVSLSGAGAFFIQRPGELEWGPVENVSTSADSLPTRYDGGSLCRFEELSGYRRDWEGTPPMILIGSP